jgi:hypothetical protein
MLEAVRNLDLSGLFQNAKDMKVIRTVGPVGVDWLKLKLKPYLSLSFFLVFSTVKTKKLKVNKAQF